ncbi:MAG: hypothetical protein KGJ13_04730 [Patescibacteria group bacterium]|nr:hypothetical protein [Patescibacteria group bacterium]
MSWFLGPTDLPQTGPLLERQKFGVSRDERGYSDVPNPLAGKHYPFSGNPEPKSEGGGVLYPGLAGACVHNSDVKLKVSVKGASQGIADSVLDSMRGYPGIGSALQRDFAEDAEEERERALASVENSYPGIHNREEQEKQAKDAPAGMEHVVKGLKKAKDVDNPYAVAWWLYDKKK